MRLTLPSDQPDHHHDDYDDDDDDDDDGADGHDDDDIEDNTTAPQTKKIFNVFFLQQICILLDKLCTVGGS